MEIENNGSLSEGAKVIVRKVMVDAMKKKTSWQAIQAFSQSQPCQGGEPPHEHGLQSVAQ